MDDLKFEKALERLEEIVRLLEKGEITLEESLKLFEEGVKLARHCSTKLDEAEGKIKILAEETSEVRLETFEVNGK